MARPAGKGSPSRRSRVETLVHDLRRASFTMQAHFRAALAVQGLSMGQFVVLRGLVSTGTGTTRDLARSMGVTTGNITGLVDKLEAEGLAVRERSTQDRRVVYLRPTEKGRRVMAGLRDAVTTEVARAFDGWSLADLDRLDALLRRIPRDCAPFCGGLRTSPLVDLRAPGSPPFPRADRGSASREEARITPGSGRAVGAVGRRRSRRPL